MAATLTAETTNRATTVSLSLGFALTGFGMALPGAALPALLTHWHLQDRGGGLLFLLAWLGSTGGAVLARGNQMHSVVRGAALTCAAALLLVLVAHPWIYPVMLAYGLGLGITMTSISVLRAQQTAAALATSLTEPAGSEGRTAYTPAHEMNRLNMIWAIGALICPPLTAQALRTSSPGPLLAAMGAAFGAVAVAVFLTGLDHQRNPGAAVEAPVEVAGNGGVSEAVAGPGRRGSRMPLAYRKGWHSKATLPLRLPALPWMFALFAALAVGLESALGGWLTTYTQRAQHGVSVEVSVTTALWAGLLLSRALHTSRLAHKTTPARWLQAHALLTLVSVCLIAVTHGAVPLLALTLLAGTGLGPLYPMTLGYVLPRYRGRLVFVLAGAGSAFFPWATGTLSTYLQSLRQALIVPCLAAVGIAVLAVLLLRSTSIGEPVDALE